MGIRDAARAAFGGGKTPAARPSVPSTKDMEKQRAARQREAAASSGRGRRHRFMVARYGDRATIPFDD